MTIENIPEPTHDDDEQLAALFRSFSSDVPPPDREFLDRLREISTEEFLRGTARVENLPPAAVVWKGRSVAAAVVALVVFVGFFLAPLAQNQLPPAFGEVLGEFAAADTLHMQLTRNGKTEELWIRQPGQLRRQADAARYRIVQGSRLWRIDESENSAAEEDSPYFQNANSHFDVLNLLDVGGLGEQLAKLKKQPSGRALFDGKECHRYRVDLPQAPEGMRIEAFVEVGTNQLRLLETQVRRKGHFEPVSEVRVLALNRPIDDEKFVVGKNLTADGRVGKIVDAEGLVTLKPVMNRRWTPVSGSLLLKPGDWLRTDVRGANAVSARLEGGTEITLGPGSLIEFIKPHEVRLFHGEAQFKVGEAGCTLRGPGDAVTTVKGLQLYRIQEEKLSIVNETPQWLAGFEGTTVNESLGSLIAKVDGRDVPLTVGYHHVNVEIRDQIARTTIEESFVNHTGAQLEGVFHFPLPADASISGFGMWIGDELVEADVVEKQRAREIYETILREKRDPGLLEWAGGNIFKARVFPILAHSEKRIKITYTQVLPLQGNVYRYSYGLQSEMLRQTPLRELAIDLKVHSALPLKSIKSPTHDTRTALTGNSGHLEFTAQEYRPERDFEAVIELADSQADVVVIPHRRGDDGYFLMQVMPPSGEGALLRDVLPNGRPLDLLLVADTSGSMDRAQRAKQEEFIVTLLTSLSPQDRFNIICCDVGPHLLFKESVAATEENRATVRTFLSARLSLGWTELESAFREVMQRVREETQVIYIGDGIVTTTDVDADDFSNRLKRMYADKGTFHAVATGNSYESSVLQAMASLGGGSWRAITGETGPRGTAVELLKEISQPVLRDITLDFQGLQVAAVYPERLPNVPAGRQQIILGRYLPEGEDQVGEVIVSGTLHGEKVRYRSRITLADAEHGNSFIPRLWARQHLDQLLAQGGSQEIQDEIIGLSEEFHIMTPYTSLLVLETDADRERFKVKRRFQMRDGERFFAKGREDANYELRQQQMQLAGNWRLELRKAVLQELSGMGRDLGVTVPQFVLGGGGGSFYGSSGIELDRFSRQRFDNDFTDRFSVSNFGVISDRSKWFAPQSGPVDFEGHGVNQFGESNSLLYQPHDMPVSLEDSGPALPSAFYLRDDIQYYPPTDSPVSFEGSGPRAYSYDFNGNFQGGTDSSYQGEPSIPRLLPLDEYRGRRSMLGSQSERAEALVQIVDGGVNSFGTDGFAGKPASFVTSYFDSEPLVYLPQISRRGRLSNSREYYAGNRIQFGFDWAYLNRYQPPENWLGKVVPQVPAVPQQTESPPPADWSAEAIELAGSLSRHEQLAKLAAELEISQTNEVFEPRWQQTIAQASRLDLVSPTAWMTREERAGNQTLIHWCDAKQRGILSRAFLLGQVRDSQPEDLRQPPLDLPDYSWWPLAQRYQGYSAAVKPAGENRVELVLTLQRNEEQTQTFLIDTARHVVLKVTHTHGDKLWSVTEFSDFVEAGGGWWAQRIETRNAQNQVTQSIQQTVRSLEKEPFAQRMTEELALREQALLLPQPLPAVLTARKAIAGGGASIADYLTMLQYEAATQQWDRVWELVPGAEQAAGGKAGFRWIRDQLLRISRRNEELQQRILAEAERLAAAARTDDLYLAEFLLNETSGFLQGNEQLQLQTKLRPVFDRQAEWVQGRKRWLQQRVNLLNNARRYREAFDLTEQLAQEYRHDDDLQIDYARTLAGMGDYPAAYAWLNKAVQEEPLWDENERQAIRNTHAGFLRQQSRYADLVAYFKAWAAENPPEENVYAQYLDALMWNNQVDDAETLLSQWLALGVQQEPLSREQSAQLHAAVNKVTGRGYGLRGDVLLEKWEPPLAAIMRDAFQRGRQQDLANRIMQNHLFTRTDACRAIRREISQPLVDKIENLPVEDVQRYVNWILPNEPVIEQDIWEQIAAAVQARWAAKTEEHLRRQWGDLLQQIYAQRFGAPKLLEFLRLRLARSEQRYRDYDVLALFNTLLQQPWSADQEQDLFVLLPKLSAEKNPAQRLSDQIGSLRQLVDRMIQIRSAALWSAVEHPEKLTRIEQRDKQAELLKQARTDFADALAEQAGKQEPLLKDWLTVERVYLDVLLERNLEEVLAQCWEVLGDAPPVTANEDDPLAASRAVLRERYLLTLMNLAARKAANPALIERLIKFIDAGIGIKAQADAWRSAKYQLLVALDRAEDLEKDLRQWIQESEDPAAWQKVLARLIAEQGQLAEAVKLFETVEADEELSPADYRVLAAWYMALDRREDYERAMRDIFNTSGENELWNYLQQQLQLQQRGRQGGLSTPIEPQVLSAFGNLLRRSTNPQQHLGLLQQFYQVNHEFRLLEGLAEAVTGQTPERIYPFLRGMSQVLAEVRDEATADEILKQIQLVRMRAKTETDRRALDLLEALVERRAAELQNQPGPHVSAAVAAMRRAFERQWAAGEPRLMADWLDDLGVISQRELADEQVRELHELYQRETPGTSDRLHIGHRLATAAWRYGEHDKALAWLEVSLREYEQNLQDQWPADVEGPLFSYVNYLEAGYFARGEAVLQHWIPLLQRDTLNIRLLELYRTALDHGGEVSLGRGNELYRNLQQLLKHQIAAASDADRRERIRILCAVYATAHRKQIAAAQEDLKGFAFNELPEILNHQRDGYEQIISQATDTLREVSGPYDALAFLIDRIEHEPARFRYSRDDSWQRYAGRLASLKQELGNFKIGALTAPFLQIISRELRRELTTQQSRNQALYHKSYDEFWQEQRPTFAAVAEGVLAKHQDSATIVPYIANYFYYGLGRHDRAIQIMFQADDRGLLNDQTKFTLVIMLHEQGRQGESIPLLRELVEHQPDNRDYRGRLMQAYHAAHRPEDLLAFVDETDKYYHSDGRWYEENIAVLARGCLMGELNERAVAYFKELIDLHERTHRNRGVGGGTLSTYYTELSSGYSKLRQTANAVDAACGAIVSWGPRHHNRQQALDALVRVLTDATDRDAYVRQLDQEVEKSGQDKPIVRKSLGQAYINVGQFQPAAVQLELALEFQPADMQTQQLLLDCYQNLNEKPQIIKQLLRMIELQPREIGYYRQLGEQYTGDAAQQERAYTSIVEAQPLESESHALLAEIRQSQDRWNEAAEEWRRVAEIRKLEPTGLLGLANAQIHLGEWAAAERTVEQLRNTKWPDRFEIKQQVRELGRRVREREEM